MLIKQRMILFSLIFFSCASVFAAVPPPSHNRCENSGSEGVKYPVDALLPKNYRDSKDYKEISNIVKNFSKVTPARMIQSVVDHLYTFHDLCGVPVAGVGGWEDSIGTDLCERLAAFDLSHNYILSQTSTKLLSDLASNDFSFLKTAFESCRLSTRRCLDYSTIAHVSYKPTPKQVQYLNKAIGLDD